MPKLYDEKEPDSFDKWITRAIDNKLVNLHTAMPGEIEAFDETTQLAQIKPLIKRIFTGGNDVAIKSLIHVPIMSLRAGGFVLTFPVSVGDECLVIFCERAIDAWLQSGGAQKPTELRRHDYSDAVAIVGLNNQTNPISGFSMDGLQIRNESGNTVITIKDGEIDITAPLMTVTAPTTTWTGDINLTGILTATGEVLSNTIPLSTHVHTGVQSGPSNTGTPIQ